MLRPHAQRGATMNNAPSVTITVIDESGRVHRFRGRMAWALRELILAGDRGCTPLRNPGPRWSAYVHKLRAYGFDIETTVERHAGPFSGNHGRYVLHTRLRIDQCEVARSWVANE